MTYSKSQNKRDKDSGQYKRQKIDRIRTQDKNHKRSSQ
jgi:hypothetical protein